MQYQISTIENGFLVMSPPKSPTVIYKNQQAQQPEPCVVYCADKEAICKHLMEIIAD